MRLPPSAVRNPAIRPARADDFLSMHVWRSIFIKALPPFRPPTEAASLSFKFLICPLQARNLISFERFLLFFPLRSFPFLPSYALPGEKVKCLPCNHGLSSSALLSAAVALFLNQQEAALHLSSQAILFFLTFFWSAVADDWSCGSFFFFRNDNFTPLPLHIFFSPFEPIGSC